MMPGLEEEEIRAAAKHWGVLAAVGVLLIVLGVAAICAPIIATDASIVVLAFLLITGGIAAIIGGIVGRQSGGLAFYLLMGVLALMAGLFVIRDPLGSTLAITLLLAIWLLVSGVFRLIAAFVLREGRGWLTLGGVLAIVLGLLLWRNWPSDAGWFIGLVVGIELIFQGFAWLTFGLAAKSIRESGEAV